MELALGSYASLIVRNSVIFQFRSEIDHQFSFLFTQDEFGEVRGRDRKRLPSESRYNDEDHLYALSSFAGHLVDRLDVLGIGLELARQCYVEARSRSLDTARTSSSHIKELSESYVKEAAFLDGLEFDDWLGLLKEQLGQEQSRSWSMEPGSLSSLLGIWDYEDGRFLLRAILHLLDPSERVEIDVTELCGGGWIDPSYSPRSAWVEYSREMTRYGSPAVVLTEGSSDSEFIRDSLRILRPHLAEFVTFPDFSAGAEGGAAQLVKTVRAFQSTSIANRIVALFDNDAAGYSEASKIQQESLPSNISILHYPDLKVARSYPTKGPSGEKHVDVNRLACSIEMYLGVDCLTDPDSDCLVNVRWGGQIGKTGNYQGALESKREIQSRFRDKVSQAREGAVSDSGDWSGMEAIIDCLLRELSSGVKFP